MKKTLQTLAVTLAAMVLSTTASAQTTYEAVQIKDLLTYPTAPAAPTDLTKHPKAGLPVKFTAIVSSYPKNSGNASYTSSTNVINRMHIFVVDTNAAETGRFYQSMQIVEGFTGTSPAAPHVGEQIEALNVGDIATFSGKMEYFQEGVQFNVDEVALVALEPLVESGDYEARYQPLLKPVEVDLADLITKTESGTWNYDVTKYGKYFGMYVKIKDATVSNRLYPNTRPYFAVNQGDIRIYTADISLRYRNDRSLYKTGYNWRRAATEVNGEGDFVPPVNGSLVDASGYLLVNQFNPDNHSSLGVGGTSTAFSSFKLVPWDDGIVWLNGVKNTNGVGDFTWNQDIVVKGVPPGFSNVTVTPENARSTDKVTVSATILPEGEGVTLSAVVLYYKVGSADEANTPLTSTTNVYSYEFPLYENGTSVTWRIEATASNGLKGVYGPNTFVINDAITSIAQIQKTSNELEGPSPFVTGTNLVANFSATVVADSIDGTIVIHQAATPWSGIFLVNRAATQALRKGDVINVTQLRVLETSTTVTRGVTYLDSLRFTKTGTNANYANLIPTITTADLRNDVSRAEKYEGMVIKLVNVAVSNRNADSGIASPGDNGEFEVVTTTRPDTLARDYYNSGFRVNDDLPSSSIRTWSPVMSNQLNENLRVGAVISITGVVYASFDNPKVTPLGGLRGITGTNYTYPIRSAITAVSPVATLPLGEAATVFAPEFTTSITFSGTTFRDFDGGKVKYVWAATLPSDSVAFANPLAFLAADTLADGTTAGKITLTHGALDQLLANAGVGTGETANLVWTVFASDGTDFVRASSWNFATWFTPRTYKIAITRSGTVSNENDRKLVFNLEQNFPNPFNPTTSIRYSVPAAGHVKLSVYDMLGREVAVPVNGRQAAGIYTNSFDASSLASGIYLYRLEHAGKVMTRKMLLVK
jgi:hypothetical protein